MEGPFLEESSINISRADRIKLAEEVLARGL